MTQTFPCKIVLDERTIVVYDVVPNSSPTSVKCQIVFDTNPNFDGLLLLDDYVVDEYVDELEDETEVDPEEVIEDDPE